MQPTALDRLTAVLTAVCPIAGLTALSPTNPVIGQGNVGIDYAPQATPEERAAADAALAGFDWSQAAQNAWLRGREVQGGADLIGSETAVAFAVRASDSFGYERSNDIAEFQGAVLRVNAARFGLTPADYEALVTAEIAAARQGQTFSEPPPAVSEVARRATTRVQGQEIRNKVNQYLGNV